MRGLWYLLTNGFQLPFKIVERSANTIFHRGEAGYGSYINFGSHFRLDKRKKFLKLPKREADVWAVNFMDPVETLDDFLPVVYVEKEGITKTNFCANDTLLCFADGKFLTPPGLKKELLADGFEINNNLDVAVFGAFIQKGVLEGLTLFNSVVKAITEIPSIASGFVIRNDETVFYTDPFNLTNLVLYLYGTKKNEYNIISSASEPQAFGEFDPFYWEKMMKGHPFSNGYRDLFSGELIGVRNNKIVSSVIMRVDNLKWAGGSGKETASLVVGEDSLDELIALMPWVDDKGLIHDGVVEEYHCIFEDIYKKNPPALNHLVSTIRFRARLGRYLSRIPGEQEENVVVMPVPDSGRSAASGYSNEYNYKLKEGLIKRVKRRSYLVSDENRDEIADDKYEVVPGAFNNGKQGKTVVFLDDSIVRGTTIYRMIIKAFEAGAREVFFKSTSPPLRHFCPYSEGMTKKSDFVAMNRDLDEIYEWVFNQCREEIKNNYEEGVYNEEKFNQMLSKINKEKVNIEYMTIDNLIDCYNSFFADNKQRICTGCMTGVLPFEP